LALSAGPALAKGGGGEKRSSTGKKAGLSAGGGKTANSGIISKSAAGSDKSAGGKALAGFKQKLSSRNGGMKEGQIADCKFTDVKGHWAESAIQRMSVVELFKGYGDGTFRPDDPVTQAEAVALVMRIIPDETEDEINSGTNPEGQTDGGTAPANTEANLSDTPQWAKEAVEKAVMLGVINLNRFHSQVQVNRAQAAVMVAKALGLQPADATNAPFKDGILISQEDIGYILALYQEGIINGSPEGWFNPNSAITRAELAVIMEKLVSEPVEDGENNETGETQPGETDTGADPNTETGENDETSGSNSQAGDNTQTGSDTQAGENTNTQTGESGQSTGDTEQ